jgi:hypothetical protein
VRNELGSDALRLSDVLGTVRGTGEEVIVDDDGVYLEANVDIIVGSCAVWSVLFFVVLSTINGTILFIARMLKLSS